MTARLRVPVTEDRGSFIGSVQCHEQATAQSACSDHRVVGVAFKRLPAVCIKSISAGMPIPERLYLQDRVTDVETMLELVVDLTYQVCDFASNYNDWILSFSNLVVRQNNLCTDALFERRCLRIALRSKLIVRSLLGLDVSPEDAKIIRNRSLPRGQATHCLNHGC